MPTLQAAEDTDLSSFADWRTRWTDYVALTRVMDDVRTPTARQGLLRSALHPEWTVTLGADEAKMYTVIAQIFVRDLISYISYFLAESTKFSSTRKPYTYTSVSDTTLAVRTFLAYENQQMLEYEIFTRTKISAITVTV